jgi:hypothetical protein
MRYITFKKYHFIYLSGKPMTPHLPAIRGIFDLRYQGLAVDDYSCGFDALDLWYPRLSIIKGITMISIPQDMKLPAASCGVFRRRRINTLYNALLIQKAVPDKYHPYYRKWLRYYLDFC